jgi:hypothetical protein
MDKLSISTSLAPEIIITQVTGDLEVSGWGRSEVVVTAEPDQLNLEEGDDLVRLSCPGTCNLRVPGGSLVRVEEVGGNAIFRMLDDQLSVEVVQGSLALREIGAATIEAVHGNLAARDISGDLHVNQTHGNVSLRKIRDGCTLGAVHGNLDLRNVEGEAHVYTKGNARLQFNVLNGAGYSVRADGNIRCTIPEEASLKLDLSSEASDIRIGVAGESTTYPEMRHEETLGAGEAVMSISAGGSIYINIQKPIWDGPMGPEIDLGEGFEALPDEISQKIARQVEAQVETQMAEMTREINERMARLTERFGKAGLSAEETERLMEQALRTSERETARAQEKIRRAQAKLERKLEASLRRRQRKSKAADRRSRSHVRSSQAFDWPAPGSTPAADPVTEEERLMILRMLEEKKISLEEADQLLTALEGESR